MTFRSSETIWRWFSFSTDASAPRLIFAFPLALPALSVAALLGAWVLLLLLPLPPPPPPPPLPVPVALPFPPPRSLLALSLPLPLPLSGPP
jgi:hypothetical protein